MKRSPLVLLLALSLCGLAACSSGGSSAQSGDGDGGTNSATAALAPTDRLLRRLTRFEYDNTVSDLVHITSTYGQGLPPEDVVNVFDNNAAALVVGPLLAEKAQDAAEQIAAAAVMNLSAILPCNASAGRPCAVQFVSTFGARALRRPLSDAEAARYLALYDQEAADGGFTQGITAIVSAMLQSPYFLYRSEIGAPAGSVYALTPYEIATELSYLLWGTMPDDALSQAAQSGALSTPAQISAQAQRLLQSPRSRPVLDHFVSQWLLLDHLAAASKVSTLYPDFTPAIQAAMLQESTALFASVVGGSGMLSELLSANYSYMSDALARFYGITQSQAAADASGLRRTPLPAERAGAGFLTHASILATQAKPDNSSPVLRGKLVRERLLCQNLPPPPAGVNVQLPPLAPNQTNRARFTEHSQNPSCAGCHHLMDPVGFGFERFDAVGRYQTMANGLPIDDSGQVEGTMTINGTFNGVVALAQSLSTAPEVSACVAQQWFSFAYGIEPDARSAGLLTQISTGFAQSGANLPALILGLTQTPRFTQRAPDPDVGVPGATPSPDMAGGTAPPPPAPDMTTPPPNLFSGQLTTNSDWATGYCATVNITNNGPTAGNWTVTLSIEGLINNIWNASPSTMGAAGASTQISFTGASYNANLAPGASTSFGFCAQK